MRSFFVMSTSFVDSMLLFTKTFCFAVVVSDPAVKVPTFLNRLLMNTTALFWVMKLFQPKSNSEDTTFMLSYA